MDAAGACGEYRIQERPPTGGRWRATQAAQRPLCIAVPRCVLSEGNDVGRLDRET